MPKPRNILKNGKIFNEPENGRQEIPCVYRLVVDDNLFYVGSTRNLKQRIGVFKSNCNRLSHPNKALNKAVEFAKVISIEVLEIVGEISDLRDAENKHLNDLFDENCLNRSVNAYSNKGVLWTEEEKKKISDGMKGVKKSPETILKMRNAIKRRSKEPTNSIRINHFDLKGNLLNTFSSISQATFFVNISEGTISDILRGNKKSSKGHIFRYYEEPKRINPFDELCFRALAEQDADVAYFNDGKAQVAMAMKKVAMEIALRFYEYVESTPAAEMEFEFDYFFNKMLTIHGPDT